jgi:hypothetical protein
LYFAEYIVLRSEIIVFVPKTDIFVTIVCHIYEIFDRNVLQASYKKAKCLVSGTETFFFRMKTPISDWNENLSLSRKLLCDRNFIPTSVNNCYGLF